MGQQTSTIVKWLTQSTHMVNKALDLVNRYIGCHSLLHLLKFINQKFKRN